jgi:DNA-binding transcriptional ArsR family regulator
VTQPVTQPVREVRVVSDPIALKALADPLRVRMLELLARQPDRLWTVKELAAELGQPVTKLYHHVKLLAASELVRDADTRIVSGIVEHRYACAQHAIKLDDALFGSPANRDSSVASVAGIVDQVRDGLVEFLSRPDTDLTQVTMGRALARLTEQERAEVAAHLEQVIDDIESRREAVGDRTGLPRYAVTVVMHPMVD